MAVVALAALVFPLLGVARLLPWAVALLAGSVLVASEHGDIGSVGIALCAGLVLLAGECASAAGNLAPLTSIERRLARTLVVRIAAETVDLVANARMKLEAKNLDLVVANDVTAPGAGFGGETNAVVCCGATAGGGRAARLEAGGRRAHPRRGARLALGGRGVSSGKARLATGASERDETLADLLAHGRFLSGLSSVGVAPPSPAAVRPDPAETGIAATGAGATRPDDPAAALAAIREDLGDCRRCKLASGRKTIVFGQGNPQAELMFVGEAPGADEDEQGLAWVARGAPDRHHREGHADASVPSGSKRAEMPAAAEPGTGQVLPALPRAQIRAIRPHVGLGKFAAQWLLRPRAISRSGRFASATASRSCRPTTRPTSCGTPPGRRTSGRT
jgi:DNA polymerase